MDDLRRQVRMLEAELQRKNQVAEKPYEIKKVQSPRDPPPKVSNDEVCQCEVV